MYLLTHTFSLPPPPPPPPQFSSRVPYCYPQQTHTHTHRCPPGKRGVHHLFTRSHRPPFSSFHYHTPHIHAQAPQPLSVIILRRQKNSTLQTGRQHTPPLLHSSSTNLFVVLCYRLITSGITSYPLTPTLTRSLCFRLIGVATSLFRRR